MPDEIHIPPELTQLVIAAACATAGPVGDNQYEWNLRVEAAIPFIAAKLRPGGWDYAKAEAVLTAQVFRAAYVSYTYEETSTRCVVTLADAKTGEAENRPIRTHRTDTPSGKRMRERLDALKPGTELLVYKSIEDTNVADKKVRILSHFEVLKGPSSSGVAPAPPVDRSVSFPQTPTDAEPAFSPQAQPAPAPVPPAPGREHDRDDEVDADMATVLSRLSPKQRVDIARRAASEGILNIYKPTTPHERHRLALLCRGEEEQF